MKRCSICNKLNKYVWAGTCRKCKYWTDRKYRKRVGISSKKCQKKIIKADPDYWKRRTKNWRERNPDRFRRIMIRYQFKKLPKKNEKASLSGIKRVCIKKTQKS